MKVLKWMGITTGAVVALLAVAALVTWRWSVGYITTPVVPEPDRPILSQLRDPLALPVAAPPWAQAARAHQRAAFDPALFSDPPLTFGPWTRWWWPGNAVEPAELEREIALFAANGIAGVEIQPFAVSVSEHDRGSKRWQEHGWDSPAFYENLRVTMEAASRAGIGVDLNNGSGWPTGGPHVSIHDGMRQLVHSETIVSGPREVSLALAPPEIPLAAYANEILFLAVGEKAGVFVGDNRQLVEVVAARITKNERTAWLWDLQDQIVVDPDSTVVLTDRVTDEVLSWSAPDGEWVVTTLWQMPGGEMVSGGYAHPAPAYVVDHLDAKRIRANQDYLYREETGLARYFGAPFRAFFNDSLEFKQERHWALGHLEEFEKRRGYDPRPWLAALVEPGKDQMMFHAGRVPTRPAYDLGERGRRFREDWDLTTSDLFRERFLEPSGRWAAERSLTHRSQAYGAPIDVLRAAGAADIPEAEQLYGGGSEMFLKAISSGAHLYDRPLVTAESFVFQGRAFMTTPMKIKALADKAFAAGINQLIYHGSAYQVRDGDVRGYPRGEGWYPWQAGMFSTDFSEMWPYWEHAPQLNRYIARAQYVLQMGEPETDVLVLYPGLGFPQGFTNPEEPFDQGSFEGEEAIVTPAPWGEESRGTPEMRATWRVVRGLEQQGLTWEWVNEHALGEARLARGALRGRALLLHDIAALHPQTAEQIAALAEAGLPVIVRGDPPARQRGLADFEAGDDRVRRAMARVAAVATAAPPTAPIEFAHEHVKTIRRRLADGELAIFLANPTPDATRVELRPLEEHAHATWLDPWTGEARSAVANGDGRLAVRLEGYGSEILWLHDRAEAAFPPPTHEPGTGAWPIADFDLRVEDPALPGGIVERAQAVPFDWLEDPELRSSGGPGIYTASFEAPTQLEDKRSAGYRFAIELGRVAGAARVRLNGVELGAALIPPYTVNATTALRAGANELEVVLVPPRKNRLVPAIEADEQGWEFANLIGATQRVSAGLLGPVRLLEQRPVAGVGNE